jgi:hypothetical protein
VVGILGGLLWLRLNLEISGDGQLILAGLENPVVDSEHALLSLQDSEALGEDSILVFDVSSPLISTTT